MQMHYLPSKNGNKALMVNVFSMNRLVKAHASRVSLLIKSKPNWQTDRNQDQKAQSRLGQQGSRDPPTEGGG